MSALFRITLCEKTVELELSRREVAAVRRVSLELACAGAPFATVDRVPPRERRARQQLTAEQSAAVDAQMAQMPWGDGDGLI